MSVATATTYVKHSKRTLRTPCDGCGAMNLYKGHIVAEDTWCDECGILVGDDVLLNYDETLHVCSGVHVITTATATAEFREIAAPAPAESMDANKAQAAMAALQDLFGAPKAIDHAEVERIAREVINGVVYPTKTVVVRDGERTEIEGTTHPRLGDVVMAVSAGEHVMMVGPAGTGKSTIAEQAATSLNMSSYSISLSPQTPASALLGYMQAAGEYVRTLFREAYENGGVFHFDEVDNAHPSVLAVINAGLANGHMAFPDGMVKRHEKFRTVASANTYGRGANRQYVGRQQLDAATLDRFSVITIDVDEALETALVYATGVAKVTADKVLTYVRKLRSAGETNGLNVVLSPRASVGMARLLHAGFDWDQAVDSRVRRGLDDTTWDKLSR